MKQIVVLGSGMVGSAMALDMASQHSVLVADKNEENLQKLKKKNVNIKISQLDVTNENELAKILKPADLVICAVPGFLGFQTMEKIIKNKKNVVDISFFPENALELNELAIENGVTAVVDCGVAPGMGNIILGHYDKLFQIENFTCMVGGLPEEKKWPFYYKAPFSPVDVIEEYTRPARFVENGFLITREALSDVELIDFDEVGSLEAFNSDGLRSLIFTMPHIKNMKEKTLRYPGHVEYIQVLKKTGFFDSKPVEIDGNKIKPIDFTSKILFGEWKLGEKEKELTIMEIAMEGRSEERSKKVIYRLLDRFDEVTGISSMARTTGYTATAVANFMLNGHLNQLGILPPELVGRVNGCLQYVLTYLSERGVVYHKTEL
ncbi:MAG: saccharopine dehydrogenase C-terminal domain-containing protein [Lutimonas sp.]